MNAYNDLINTLYDLLIADPSVDTVTKGDLLDVQKKNDFPLAHINVLNASFQPGAIRFGVAVFAMALRDHVNPTQKDKWKENDNENENLNSMLYVLHRLHQKLEKLNETIFLVSSEPLEPFTEAKNNVVDGWLLRMEVDVIETESGAC